MKELTAFLLKPLDAAERKKFIDHWNSNHCGKGCLFLGFILGVAFWILLGIFFIMLAVLFISSL